MKKKFHANGKTYEIPESEVANFLKDFPNAEETKSYDVKGKKYDIPLSETAAFESEMGLKKKEATPPPVSTPIVATPAQEQPIAAQPESVKPSNTPAAPSKPLDFNEVGGNFGVPQALAPGEAPMPDPAFFKSQKELTPKPDYLQSFQDQEAQKQQQGKFVTMPDGKGGNAKKFISFKTLPNNIEPDFVEGLQKRIKSGVITDFDANVIAKNEIPDLTDNRYTPSDDSKLNDYLRDFKLPKGEDAASNIQNINTILSKIQNNPEDVYQDDSGFGSSYLSQNQMNSIAQLNAIKYKLAKQELRSKATIDVPIDASQREENDGNNLKAAFRHLLNMGSNPTGDLGQAIMGSEFSENRIQLKNEFWKGMEFYRTYDPVLYDRVYNQVKNKLPMSQTQIATIESMGVKLKKEEADEDLLSDKITVGQHAGIVGELYKSSIENTYKHPEVLRASLAGDIAEAGEKEAIAKGEDPDKTWSYPDDFIAKAGRESAISRGLDPDSQGIKDAITYLQKNEGVLPMQNSIAKRNKTRDLFEGLAEPIRGVANLLDPKTGNSAYIQSQSAGSTMVADSDLDSEKAGFLKYRKGIIKGAGQFATQAALAYVGSSFLGSIGGALKIAAPVAEEAGAALAGEEVAAANAIAAPVDASLSGSIKFGKNFFPKARDFASTMITSYAQVYDSNYKTAQTYTANDETAANIANVQSAMEGLSENLLSPLEVARGIGKGLFKKGDLAKGLLKVFTEGNILEQKSALKQFVGSTFAGLREGGKVAANEITEEFVTQTSDLIANSIYNPESFKRRDIADEYKEVAIQTGLTMVLPALMSGLGAARSNTFSKSMLLFSAQDRQSMQDQLDGLRANNHITEKDYQEKSIIINTASHINENLPTKNNGKELSPQEKEDFIFNRVSQKLIEKKLKNENNSPNFDLEEPVLLERQKSLLEESSKILNSKTVVPKRVTRITQKEDKPAPINELDAALGEDVRYNREVGVLQRDEEGNYVVARDNKEYILPVKDKNNPVEKAADLGVEVLPAITGEQVQNAQRDAEQVGMVKSNNGNEFFISLANPNIDNEVGDQVMMRDKKGKLKQVPGMQDDVKLGLINKFLQEKGLPARTELIPNYYKIQNSEQQTVAEQPAPVAKNATTITVPVEPFAPPLAEPIVPANEVQPNIETPTQEPTLPNESTPTVDAPATQLVTDENRKGLTSQLPAKELVQYAKVKKAEGQAAADKLLEKYLPKTQTTTPAPTNFIANETQYSALQRLTNGINALPEDQREAEIQRRAQEHDASYKEFIKSKGNEVTGDNLNLDRVKDFGKLTAQAMKKFMDNPAQYAGDKENFENGSRVDENGKVIAENDFVALKEKVKQLRKEKNTAEIKKINEAPTAYLKTIQDGNEANNTPTQEQTPAESTAGENKDNIKNNKAGKRRNVGNRVNKAKRVILNPVYRRALEIDSPSLEQQVMQYFIGGGQINSNVLKQLFGGRKVSGEKNIQKEVSSRIGLMDNKIGAKSIDDLAHALYEDQLNSDQHSEQDFREAVEQVLLTYSGKKAMAEAIVNDLDEAAKEEAAHYQEMVDGANADPQTVDEAIDMADRLTDTELEAITDQTTSQDLKNMESLQQARIDNAEGEVERAKGELAKAKTDYEKKQDAFNKGQNAEKQTDLFGRANTASLFNDAADQNSIVKDAKKAFDAAQAKYNTAVQELQDAKDNLGQDELPFAVGNVQSTDVQKAQVQKIIDFFTKGLKLNVFAPLADFEKKLAEVAKGKFEVINNAVGNPLGFVADGKIYLNPNALTPETVFHELTHVQQAMIQLAADKGDKQAAAIISKFDAIMSAAVAQIKAGKRVITLSGQKIDLSSKVYDQGKNETDAAYNGRLRNEVWAYVQAPANTQKWEKATTVNAIKNFIQAVKQWFKDKIGLKNSTDLQSLSLEQLIDRSSDSLMKGEYFNINENKVVAEIKSKNLTHVPNTNMGAKQAQGIYLSTESGNRYSNENSPSVSVQVSIENPKSTTYVENAELQQEKLNELVDANKLQLEDVSPMFFNDIAGFSNKSLSDVTNKDLSKWYRATYGNKIDEDVFMSSARSQAAQLITDQYQGEGYDSLYIPETKDTEGELVVFDRKNVQMQAEAQFAVSKNEIKSFVDDLRNEGFTDDEIRDTLEEAGNTKTDIDAALKAQEEEPNASEQESTTPANAMTITHESTENERDELGLPEREVQDRLANQELLAQADAEIQAGYSAKGLIRDLLNTKKVPTNLESAILTRHIATLKAAIQEGASNEQIKEYRDALTAAEKGGSEAGAALQARKIASPIDGSLADFFARDLDSNLGAPLTDLQRAATEAEFAEIEAAKKAYEEKIAALEAENAKLKAKKEFDAEKSKQKSTSANSKKDYKGERKSIIEHMKQKLKEANQQTYASLPYLPQLIAVAPDVAKLVKSYVQEGVTNLAEVITNIKGILEEDIPDITEKDVNDLIAGEYNAKPKVKSDVARQVFELKLQAALQNKLEALLSGPIPKIEKNKIRYNQQVEALRNKIDNLQKEYDKAQREANKPTVDQEQKSIIDGMAKALQNAARGNPNLTKEEALSIIAKDASNLLRSYTNDPSIGLEDATNKMLASLSGLTRGLTVDDVNDLIAGKYNNSANVQSEQSKRVKEIRMEAQLKNKLNDLLKGPKPKTLQAKPVYNQKVTALKKQIDDLQKQHAKEARLANAKTPEEIALQSLKTRTKSQIAELEKELASGNLIEAPVKKAPTKLDKEALDLKDKLIKLKMDREVRLIKQEAAQRSTIKKVGDFSLAVLGAPRSVLSSMDFSAPLRQGLIPTISHPIVAAEAFGEMFLQAFSQKRFDRWFNDVRESPDFAIMEKSGLYVGNPLDPRMSAREEAYMSNLPEKIPIFGTWFIKGSERAYVSYLNKMRVDLFRNSISQYQDAGKTLENSEALYKATASWINNSTGRGTLSKPLQTAAPVLNSIFFSPRLIAARVNAINPMYYAKLPWEVRKVALLDMLKFVGTGVTILALLKAAHGCPPNCNVCKNCFRIELDPRSTDFGKLRDGNKRYDIWGGFQPLIRAIVQFASGKTKNTTDGKIVTLGENEKGKKTPFGKTRASVVTSFFRSKLAPVPGSLWNLMEGATVVGEPSTPLTELKRNVLPLIATDMYQLLKDEGAKAIFTSLLPATFGVGVQNYETKPKKSK